MMTNEPQRLHPQAREEPNALGNDDMQKAALKAAFERILASNSVEELLRTYKSFKSLTQQFLLADIPMHQALGLVKHHKAKQVFEILNKKAQSCELYRQKVCQGATAVVVGAGPGGLRAAIELALMGTKVVVLEKRGYFSRNNVLQLWPGVIEDFLSLGLKVYHPRFGASGSEKVAIRRLQLVLLHTALSLGVEVLIDTEYVGISSGEVGPRVEIKEGNGHRAFIDADLLVGADGENSKVADDASFRKEVLKSSNAIGITFNFVYTASNAEEVRLQECKKAYLYYRDWFKQLADETGILLENFVYFKDETHYFVMAAKPKDLLEAGIFKKGSPSDSPDKLLQHGNVDDAKFTNFAKKVGWFVGMPHGLEFALNNRGSPDMGIFDFTKKQHRSEPCRIIGKDAAKPLLVALVGDSLISPFWPQGTGANKAVLGAMDAAYYFQRFLQAGKSTGSDRSERYLQLLAEGRSVLRCLKTYGGPSSEHSGSKLLFDNKTVARQPARCAEVTAEYSWTADPCTRYSSLGPADVVARISSCLMDTASLPVAESA